MAVSKSTIINVSGTTAAALIKWSSLASGANNVYFDVKGKDTNNIIFLVCNTNSTDVGTTAGYLYFGTSASAATGSSYGKVYSANKLNRFRVRTAPPTTDLTEGLSISTAGAHIAITAFGPFESARLKDTDGYIKVSKAKGTSDAGRVKIAAILLP